MAVLVISGSGRGSGKTAVGCALVRALPELQWMAVKATSHEHAAVAGLWEETDRASTKDTGRYLAAGAARSFLVAGAQECLAQWVSPAHRGDAGGMLVESNRVSMECLAGIGERTMQLAVLDESVWGWKPSLGACVVEADALVLTGGFPVEQLPAELRKKRIFWMVRGSWTSAELILYVRERLIGRVGTQR